MVRAGRGVEVREKSIRITFTWNGRSRHETLCLNGEPLPPTAANVKFAARVAAEVREKIKHGVFVMSEYFPRAKDAGHALSVSSQLDAWLKTQRIANSTRAGYMTAIRFWKSQPIAEKSIRHVVMSDVKAALADKPMAKPKTLHNYASVLRSALELARQDKIIHENPMGDLKLPKHQKPEVDPFSVEEMEKILADLTKHEPTMADLAEFKFFTGVRTSEAFGLKWSDVDLAGGLIAIKRGLVVGEEVERTKTSRARLVRLNSRSTASLKRQKARTFLAGGYVWLDPSTGEPFAREQFFTRPYWVPCLRRLGMRYRKPYNTRHTYATMMLMAGMTPAFCARQLGHSVQVFLTTYSRWLDGAADDVEMARLEGNMGVVFTGTLPESGANR